jgi:5'-methylthioadenosine phosphorylase
MQMKIGIIGGTGIDHPDILQNREEIAIGTKFGSPAGLVVTGEVRGVAVALIARHGHDHSINPTNVPYQAHIMALKQLGCTHILAGTAVGSLKEEIKPGDLVFTNQFIDRTTKRKQTFYEQDKVCHISVAEPFCRDLRQLLNDTAQQLGLPHHKQGTAVIIEGPRFSTKAESELFRSWNADIINMTMVPECVLAREAEICYANISMVTDYDVWHDSEVSNQKVVETMKQNVEKLKQLLTAVIPRIQEVQCGCKTALQGAMF